MKPPQAVVVVTGSELVRGDIVDANGPYLARELTLLGVEPARIVLVGDRASELSPALGEGLRADLCIVTGGLGPTHDDRTVELLAGVTGRPLLVDASLEAEIERASRAAAARLGRAYSDFAAGVRKQAALPEGAVSLGLAGTAPGIAIGLDGRAVVALPGPPGELQRLWPHALASEPVRRVLERARRPEHRVLRLFGVSESAVASALAEAGGEEQGVEVTVCARDLEINADVIARDPAGGGRIDALAAALRARLGAHVFAEDARGIEELVLGLCRSRRYTLATAESCTGGLVAARLTAVPGASDVFQGAVVAYADAVKTVELDVPEAVLEGYGAVSAEAAAAMAEGVRERLRADVGVSVTGVAGPGGGTREKPVGLVYFHAAAPGRCRSADFCIPADRETIRRRAAVVALHLVRDLLAGAPSGLADSAAAA